MTSWKRSSIFAPHVRVSHSLLVLESFFLRLILSPASLLRPVLFHNFEIPPEVGGGLLRCSAALLLDLQRLFFRHLLWLHWPVSPPLSARVAADFSRYLFAVAGREQEEEEAWEEEA